MMTAIRTSQQSMLRNIFMVPAYTVAFVLPIVTLIVTFAGMHAYCATQTDILGTPAMCVGLAQWQEIMPEAPAFTLPELQLPELPQFSGF